MTAIWLSLSLLAATCFYLACAHQRFRAPTGAHARTLRIAGWLCAIVAAAVAVVAMGLWAGVFSALTALMLALVALPYADAWRQLRKGQADVG